MEDMIKRLENYNLNSEKCKRPKTSTILNTQ